MDLKSVTIRDIARRANVSIGSVSNVLNGRDSVKPSVRAKVQAAIQDLDYRPNRRAQNLARNSTPVLSFILSNRDVIDPFHGRILEGVSRYCDEVDFSVLFSKVIYSATTEIEEIHLPAAIRNHGIADCVILGGVNYPNLVGALQKLSLSNVMLSNNFVAEDDGLAFNRVGFDDIEAACEATRYLIEMGHRDIWYIGDTALPWFNHRYQGYLQAMNEFDLKPRARTAAISDDRFVNGFRCVASILEEKKPMTAIFAGTDEVAYGCWECLQQHAISVPDDVSLIGFDDQRGPHKGLGLTTVRVEAETIGSELAKMAIQKLQLPKKLVPEVVVPTKLIKRGTCQPPKSIRKSPRRSR